MEEPESKAVICWRYVIPNVQYDGWAIVHVDSSGFLGIVSDFGNYAYRWVNWGDQDFRAFLLKLGQTDKDYLHSKLGRATCFDHKTTAKTLRQWIVEGRRNESYNQSSARECWDIVKQFEAYQYSAEWLYNHLNEEIENVTDAFSYTYENELKNFVQRVWPRIQAAISVDVAGEVTQ